MNMRKVHEQFEHWHTISGQFNKTARVHVLKVWRYRTRVASVCGSTSLLRASYGHSSHKTGDLLTLKHPKHTMERTQAVHPRRRASSMMHRDGTQSTRQMPWRPTARPCHRSGECGLATQLSAAQ